MDTAATTETMIERIGAVPEKLGASACFGQPVERDGHTLIPVARVSFGFGMGFGRGTGAQNKPSGNGSFSESGETGEGEGGGGGGTGSSTPVAVIDVSRDEVTVRPVMDPMRLAMSWMMLMGWIAFWLLMTVRTVVRERAKTRKREIEKGLATA
jgi:uncharacterized spore protein YtfJ